MVAEPTPITNQLEDPLSYLPCSTISEYRKGQVIFEPGHQCPNLYLIIEGVVKVSRMIADNEIVINLCQADDFFGEAAFLGSEPVERAVALENSKVMSWPTQNMQELFIRHPQLGIALVQLLTRRGLDLGERIGTLAVDCTSRRLAKTILQLAERMGQPEPRSPQVMHTAPFPHKLLAQHIGTTREAVTHCMNQFRRLGFILYSRRGMIVYADAVRRWLEDSAKAPTLPQRRRPDPRMTPLDTLSA